MIDLLEQFEPIKGNSAVTGAASTDYMKGTHAMADSHYTPPDHNGQVVSRYTSEKPICCEYCEGNFIDILNQAALVWRRIPDKASVTLTAFRIIHKSTKCINKTFAPAIIPHWLPLSDFFKDGEFSFEYFSAVSAGVEVNRQSLARIAILLNPLKVDARIVYGRRHGFVYLIQSPTGAYKIGRTTNPEDRMKTFEVKLPFEVEYVCVIKTKDMFGLESQLHSQFADKRVNGEWFSLSPEDVDYIKGLAE